MSDVPPLAGWTVGITAERRSAEFATALERQGAAVVHGQAISILPLADDTELHRATERTLDARPDIVVATTGVGFRGWLEAAEGWGLGGSLRSALAAAVILTRGPKARGAVRAAGLHEAWSPKSESSNEMLDHLLDGELPGRTIAIQLHGDPLPDMIAALRARGARVIEVPVYRWLPPADPEPLRSLILATAALRVDCVAFTSAPAATNFLRTADELGADLRAVLGSRVLCAAVGEVTAAPLAAAGIATVQPERARLGALVRTVAAAMPERAVVVRAAEHLLEVRGRAVVLDGMFRPLSEDAVVVLRSLVTGGSTDLAGANLLRAALGDHTIVTGDAATGYRLAPVGLELDYEAAWREWDGTSEQAAWDPTSGDGVTPAAP